MFRLPLVFALLLASIKSKSYALVLPFEPVPDAALQGEGLSPQAFEMIAAVPSNGGPADRTGWTITTDGDQANLHPASNALDGNPSTYYHSRYNPTTLQLPHTITIDTKSLRYINGITYLPRQDGGKNGNIGEHKIYLSTDGVNFGNPVAFGTWYDGITLKSSAWETVPARYVRIVAVTEAGGRGPWSSAAEFNVYTVPTYTPPVKGLGAWGPTIDFPLVPVAAAVQPDSGNILTWSSWAYNYQYSGPPAGQTLTSIYNPATKIVTERLIQNTKHDMFCPGISVDGAGHVIVTGGNSASQTSTFIGGPNTWSASAPMEIARGYQAQVTLGSGNIFTIGGSWNGGVGGKMGEVYDPTANRWSKLPNTNVKAMYTADTQGVWRQDNHAWLFNWKGGRVFQAGPSIAMNWFNTDPNAAKGTVSAGSRVGDRDAMCGPAVMYDAVAGKILAVGGSPNYQGAEATSNAHIITIGAPDTAAQTEIIGNMYSARIFASSVVLPDGTVFVSGGQTYGLPYSDGNASYTPEIFNPVTKSFHKQLPNSTPRVYHSFALLNIDATVIVGGGGLCGSCSTNHFDAQIFTPQYLLNADGSKRTQPVIKSISSRSNKPGSTIIVVTDGAIASFSLIRYGTATHTVNTDQRRVAIAATELKGVLNNYKITLGPADYGVVTPGYWMLFAVNAAGTPSVATTIFII